MSCMSITTKTTFGSLAAFPFPARQYIRTKFFKILQQRLLLETGLCVSPLHVFKCGACTRRCKVTLVAFVCRTICSAAIPAKNWNSSCSSAAILFPVRQIHEDNLRWQQRQLSHNMFSGDSSSCAAKYKCKFLQRIATTTTFGNRFINCRTGNRKNIARGTTDPGYWLHNLSYLSSLVFMQVAPFGDQIWN